MIHEKFAHDQNIVDTTHLEVTHHADALVEAGYEVEIMEWNSDIFTKLQEKKPDLIFNVSSLAEAAVLEDLNHPFVGADIIGCAIASDKALAKDLWIKNNLPTSPFLAARSLKDCQIFESNPPFPFPLFIKPALGRGSAGIDEHSLITSYEELLTQVGRRLNTIPQPVLIERYLQGREITCGVIGNGDSARALPLLEISFKTSNGFLTFDKKELDDDSFSCPARLDAAQTEMMQKLAVDAFKVAKLRDYGRVDMILTAEGPFLLEVNSFAGLMCTPKEKPHSYMGFMARAEGKSPGEFLGEIVGEGWQRVYHSN